MKPAPEQTRADYRYTLEIATRWSDFDMMMHLNNVQYYRYFETVVLSYLARIGSDLLRDPVIPFAVESNCKFLRPIAPAPAIDAALRIARIGNSSVQYEIGLFEKEQETPSALGRFVHVYIVRETEKNTAIPASIRGGLEKIAGSEI
ncbi:MAG: thioesterase family protein [Gammaproteobacteria bacterium]|nr:thioesterase family protein [Gammaproteobacteria bacterium]